MVVPRGIAPRRHYTLAAIGLALTLYGLRQQSANEVRRHVSTWRLESQGGWTDWATLRRWVSAVRRGVLFAGVPTGTDGMTAREVAARVAMALVARALPGDPGRPLEALAFLGAARMA
jgi:hypothetical protein